MMRPDKRAIVNRTEKTGWVLHLLVALLLVVSGRVLHADDALQEVLRERVAEMRGAGELHPGEGEPGAGQLIADFYARREFRPAWGDRDRREALLKAVEASATHGLSPSDFRPEGLASLHKARDRDVKKAAERELAFTENLIRLVYQLRFGRIDPRALYEDWNFTRTLGPVQPVDALEALVAADSLEDAIERYAPQLDAYRRLRDALKAHRAAQTSGGWPLVPPGPTLRPGDRDPRVRLIREQLVATGDHPRDAQPAEVQHFDETLRAAVVAFQSRHGLDPDGAVGRKTAAAMQVDVGRRIDQIRVNLERLRWVAQDIEGDYLLVNIAGFNAKLYLDRRLAWDSKVVVGRPYRKTPAFRADMQYLVLNPEWVLPPTILREDVLPKLARDPNYLAEHDMRVVDNEGRPIDANEIDWRRYARGGFPYQIVQSAGSDNPLGRIKFMLPNPYAVYLHDTPAKNLFLRSERAFSSGCIRLERPLDLAVILLNDPEQWNAETLVAALDTGETRNVRVRRKVPVMILYHTAEVGEDGRTYFHPDLYELDAPILAALAQPFRFGRVDRESGRGRATRKQG